MDNMELVKTFSMTRLDPVSYAHDGLPTDLEITGQSRDRFSCVELSANYLALIDRKGRGAAHAFPLSLGAGQTGLGALNEKVSLKLRDSIDHAHGELSSGAGEVYASKGKAMDADAKRFEFCNGAGHVNSVTAQAVELGDNQNVALFHLV
jgi:hypothetical protein